ncbi:lipoprotein-releasing system transmembrane protein LolC [Anaplasma platys]|uniref:Lipoprotein-releasing system transmembrane protein LolC n=1 Tax=Anaplasma platys TaxID=949 RepID=A0A858PZB9_9RICK|nr:lipoprotein-releasing ABC transporter permease subunit [Anaplasma platys]QJC27951.1 lipoprotein-releasing system transmembrane protein LolC [Anaplasma platys]
MGLEWLLARRYLSSKHGRFLCSLMSVLSILGISIGVATLISVMAVMNGFSAKLLDSILGMNGHVTVYCHRGENCQNSLAEIKATEGVVSAVPVVEGQALLKSKSAAIGAVVRGMEMSEIHRKLLEYMVSGNVTELQPGIILGSRLAESLNVNYGDEITVVSSVDARTILGSAPRTQKHKVTGIFNVGMYEYDSAFSYIPLPSAQVLFGYENSAKYIEVQLSDAEKSSAILAPIKEKTRMRVEDWKTQQGHYLYALQLERDAMFFILVLIIVVAAFNIISCVTLLVQEKIRSVAMLRTMGLSKFAVIRVFCISGMCIGVIGTAIGCCMGVLFSVNIERISDFLATFDKGAFFASIAYCLEGISTEMIFLDVIKAAALALGVTLVSTLPPAIMAARKHPVDILKYE